MGDSGESQKLEDSAVVELTGRIMVVAIIVLFVVVAFVIFLHLYAKWYWRRMRLDGTNTTRRRRLDFAGGHRELSAVTALRHGLDPSVLKSIPVIQFSPQDFKDGLECSVCLCEVSEGEKARLLPKCNHGFHVECIDMWFQSHSTCPLCRSPVSNSNSSTPDLSQEMITHNSPATGDLSSAGGVSAETLVNFPTNVLFWGNETQVSSLGSCLDLENGHQGVVSAQSVSTSNTSSSNGVDRHLVIDIPRQINEEEDQKSPAPTRLGSLKRLLSRDRKINPHSTSNVDAEQAGRSQS